MALSSLPIEEKPKSIFPEFMFKDPILTFLSLPILPFIVFTQAINSLIMTGVPKITTTETTGYYKNDEEWEMYENSGRLVIKVHRNAQRK